MTDTVPCSLCLSPKRDHALICVVEEANDVMALERTGEYRGVYHVLGGVISPLDGVGPDDLSIRELIARVDPSFKQVSSVAVEPNGQTAEAQVAEAPLPYGDTPPPSAKSSSRSTPTWRVTRRPITSGNCSSRSACASRASHAACPSAATSNTPTKRRCRGLSKAAP